MLKVGGTVLRGEWDELYGSEIVLAEGKWCSTILMQPNLMETSLLH